jgi:hypothetical protein
MMSETNDYTGYYATMLSTKARDPELVQYNSGENAIHVFDKSKKALYHIKLPEYKLTKKATADHRIKRAQLISTLAYAKDAIMMGDTKTASNYLDDYKKTWKQLETTNNAVATLYRHETERIDAFRTEAITTHGEIAEHLKRQLDTIDGIAHIEDEVERSLQSEIHGRRKKEFDIHAKMEAQKRAEYAMFSSFYTNIKPAVVAKESKKKNAEQPPPPSKPAPVEPAKPAVKSKKRTAATTTAAAKTSMVKHIILSSFPFKTREECVSKKRLAEHYMTKEDIVKVINQSAEIKSVVPVNYKSLKKDELCDALFALPAASSSGDQQQ